MTRADLCEAVYQKVGLSRTESSAFVELVLKEITDCLEKGETVKLSYSGGAFSAGELLLAPFRAALTGAGPPFEICRPLYEPHFGAALYAAKLWNARR